MSVCYDGNPAGFVGTHYGRDGIGLLGYVITAETVSGADGAGLIQTALGPLNDAVEYRIEIVSGFSGLTLEENGEGSATRESCFTCRISADGVSLGTFSTCVYIGPRRDQGVLDARRLQRRRTSRANIARDINMMYRRVDPADEKSAMYREQVPGLTVFANIGGGEFRGGWATNDRAFVVIGGVLYEIYADGAYGAIGLIQTETGPVEFDQGLFDLVFVDGQFGYVLTLSDSQLAQITDPDFYGADRVAYLDGRWIFNRPDTRQFFWSEVIDDAASYDALDFASAESGPDDLVALLRDHREIWMMCEKRTEVWFAAPSGDQVYARNNSAAIEIGCAAAHSAQTMDNSIFWIGRDKNGQGAVWTAGGPNGYQPIKVSSQDVDEALRGATDLASARAFVMAQDDGQHFYCLNVPGVECTWVYDPSVRRWHERSDLVDGRVDHWRALGHVFAFGKHIVGDADGVLYLVDPYEYTNAGDVLYREVTSPHSAAPSLNKVFFDKLRVNATSGDTNSGLDPHIEMRYSNDGGNTWTGWFSRSLGKIGEYTKFPKWERLGSARDRVWQFRVTDDCKAAIISIDVKATEGQT